jgi:cysteine desulfurase
MIYFDHNSTAPLCPEARRAWIEASERYFGNPSSPHRIGTRADAALQEARQKLAAILGCDSADLIWTSGATESANTALHHFSRTLKASQEVWISSIEHPCVRESVKALFPRRHRLIPAGPDGIIELDWLERELKSNPPGLVLLMAANNETGILQPWNQALNLCRDRQAAFFCDAVQWIGKLPAKDLGQCDMLCGSAHKFGGPKGVGFLKCSARTPFFPLLHGGPQEDERRAGTENLPGILAMIAALEKREREFCASSKVADPVEIRLSWRTDFERSFQRTLPGALIVGAGTARLWNTVCAVMPEVDCRQRWVVKLDKAGFATSTGSACSSGREKPSHVLEAIGFSPAESGRVLRFSSGWETLPEEWDSLLGGLEAVYQRMLESAKGSSTASD